MRKCACSFFLHSTFLHSNISRHFNLSLQKIDMYIYIYVYIYMYVCMSIDAYICIYTYTYTLVCIHLDFFFFFLTRPCHTSGIIWGTVSELRLCASLYVWSLRASVSGCDADSSLWPTCAGSGVVELPPNGLTAPTAVCLLRINAAPYRVP